MGIGERKQREKEKMRSLILEAAREIFLEKGYYQTSLRNIADKIEYSPGTIYLYFKEKDEIFLALHNEGFQMLFQHMEPLRLVEDPFERLKAMGRIYLEFAYQNKDMYDLMFVMNAPMNMLDDSCEWQMGDRVYDYLVQTLADCQRKGRFVEIPLEPLAFSIWSAVHGMAAIYCRNRMGVVTNENEKEMLEAGYRAFVRLLEKV